MPMSKSHMPVVKNFLLRFTKSFGKKDNMGTVEWYFFQVTKGIITILFFIFKIESSPDTILWKYYQRGIVCIIYMDPSPLAGSLFQFYFAIPTIIIVSPALEVAPV